MQTNRYNAILFGAGSSADAGIPLMNNFVDVMWECGYRGKIKDKIIPEAENAIFTEANKIRKRLEGFSIRAFFDNRNLEDILGLLSFEALGNNSASTEYETVVKAVARTIELSCIFQYHAGGIVALPNRQTLYHRFWNIFLGDNDELRSNLPALLTFNYDLVFERTLWEYFHYFDGENPNSRPKVQSCTIKYDFGMNDFSIRKSAREKQYLMPTGQPPRNGQCADFLPKQDTEATIPYYKLHGSLNWSQSNPLESPINLPVQPVDDPLILPPVFNKMDTREINGIWNAALKILRGAVNIIIVGYSLPKTDIYMQYFLKSAVGPNSNLQKIIVFDPILFQGGEKSDAMKRRYQECFAPQFSSQITFNPALGYANDPALKGSFAHFISVLQNRPWELLFYP